MIVVTGEVMNNKKKSDIIRFVFAVLFIIVSGVIIYILIPVIKALYNGNGEDILSEKVASFGAFAPVVYVAICLVQVVVAIIPGEPIEILGGILFGAIPGFLLCLLGIALGSASVYYLVKALGKPLIESVMSKEKYNSLKILNDEKKLEVLIFILFLIPGTPKDAITYFVPLTRIKPSKYFVYSTLARIPSVISSTIVGANLSKGDWKMGIIIFVITAAIGLVGILYNAKFMGKIKSKAEQHKKNK